MTYPIHTWPMNLSHSRTPCRPVKAKNSVGQTGAALAMAITALLLSACASTPPPPDWQANAFGALKSYSSAYLAGNTRVADHEFARAKAEVARTGRPDLMARLELARCATQVASLMFEPCNGYLAVSMDAKPAEQAYANFLSGNWSGLELTLLPVAYQPLVAQVQRQTTPTTAEHQLSQIEDPLSRLIAASSLLKKELLKPSDIALAVDTASNQGWRRPLLAWLGMQVKYSQTEGDAATVASLKRRIDLVLQTPAY